MAEARTVDGRGGRAAAVAVQPGQGALSRTGSPRARSSTTTCGSRRCCCRTSPAGRCRSSGSRTAPPARASSPRTRRAGRRTGSGPSSCRRPAAAWTARRWTTSWSTTCRRWCGPPTWPRSSCTCRSGRSGRAAAAREPDRLVLDLDPGAPATAVECAEVALLLRDAASAADGLTAVVKTSGSKGLQVYAAVEPVSDRRTSEYARDLAQAAGEVPPRARRLADAQGPARRQGLRRLEPEQRGQDDGRALRAAGPAGAVGVDAADLGRGGCRAAGPRTCSSGPSRCWSGSTRTATCSHHCCPPRRRCPDAEGVDSAAERGADLPRLGRRRA